MKKEKFFYNPISGSGILSISWFSGPLGDAVEANSGSGVGFFAHNGDLLGVQFDDVAELKDHQVLKFQNYQVIVDVVNGKVNYKLTRLNLRKRA
jgi:hypothetical protein